MLLMEPLSAGILIKYDREGVSGSQLASILVERILSREQRCGDRFTGMVNQITVEPLQ